MATGRLLAAARPGGMATSDVSRRPLLPPDILAEIVRRSTENVGVKVRDQFDWKRLVERAIEIDGEQPGWPLTEGQWDFGLDMLARSEAPPSGTGLATRQERIIVALSRALAELRQQSP